MPEKDTRRETLRVIGAFGTTGLLLFCVEPLQAQHVHQATPPKTAPERPGPPQFFTEREFRVVATLADLIIPETDTPGAVRAGVPAYVDRMVQADPKLQRSYRQGLQWLDDHCRKVFGGDFLALGEERQAAVLGELAKASDEQKADGLGETFFRTLRSMITDGYYTSRTGLLQELRYPGNQVLSEFPGCTHPEHIG